MPVGGRGQWVPPIAHKVPDTMKMLHVTCARNDIDKPVMEYRMIHIPLDSAQIMNGKKSAIQVVQNKRYMAESDNGKFCVDDHLDK